MKVTIDFVKGRLLLEESRQLKSRQEQEVTNDAAFPGHKCHGRKNLNNRNVNKKQNFPFKCHNCGEMGHKRANWRKPLQNSHRRNGRSNNEGSSVVARRPQIAHSDWKPHQDKRRRVYHVLSCNLLSARKLQQAGLEVIFRKDQVLIKKEVKTVLTSQLEGNLFIAKIKIAKKMTPYTTPGKDHDDTLQNETFIKKIQILLEQKIEDRTNERRRCEDKQNQNKNDENQIIEDKENRNEDGDKNQNEKKGVQVKKEQQELQEKAENLISDVPQSYEEAEKDEK
ncbi:hypothetical protein ILUMI_27252 [Ignelater luminosus]|uniref:CCHC-type domain-containing protein n=1 Tax=Ignelater luminosus TaxID=2038154 RepID=A0A8K0C6J2_IGNLU|nr:hypothetical protein ILUMI_27252 [Ignelater luminosus]